MREIEEIQQTLPNFKIKEYKILNTGAKSIAILVNNEYIFRFPLNKENIENYTEEKRILDLIFPYIKSTNIPKLEIYKTNEIIFSKHKIIEGIDYIKIQNPDIKLKKHIAEQIANFCYELHSIEIKNFNFIKTEQFDPIDYININQSNELKNILGDNFQNDLEDKFEYLVNYKNFKEDDNVLCHDDMHEENILINNNNLSGIIDFGNAIIRKRDVEFASILKYDSELTFLIIDKYEKLTNKKIDIKYILYLEKIRCYGGLLWFKESKNEKYFNLFKIFIKNLNSLE